MCRALLPKPLARPAAIIAKFVGHGIGLLLTVVAVPWLAVLALLSTADGGLYSPGRTLAAVVFSEGVLVTVWPLLATIARTVLMLVMARWRFVRSEL